MRIKIPNSPKGLKGTFFSKLFSIEMNDFSVEMLLPSLFFLVESKGKKRKEKPILPLSRNIYQCLKIVIK